VLIEEQVRWTAKIRVIARFADGREEIEEFDNIITNVSKNLWRDGLSGAVTDTEIKQVALGNNVTAPGAADVVLGNELFRKAVTQQTNPGTGQVKTIAYIAPAEATTFTIQEIGWFAGASATGTANSGVLVSRVLYNRAKTNLESLQIERTDTIS
jgi:hypothetical protein